MERDIRCANPGNSDMNGIVTVDVGSATAVVFSEKAWASLFCTDYSFLDCRLSHLPAGRMSAWTMSLNSCEGQEGIPE